MKKVDSSELHYCMVCCIIHSLQYPSLNDKMIKEICNTMSEHERKYKGYGNMEMGGTGNVCITCKNVINNLFQLRTNIWFLHLFLFLILSSI